ncbi:MAG TPA: inositol monophosphatase, partial [Candidatus Saccharimonadales bacterium]|nr:inositol monophosphatase [Candidatus Saccharimonadales bacterium]
QGLEHKEEITGATEVTIADKKINSLVIKELSKHFDDGIVGEEESTDSYGMGRRWICDPIDGTKAFVIGAPTAMFSLGLAVDGIPVLGMAYDPFLDRMYWAVKDRGSYCNGRRLNVSDKNLPGGYIMMHSDPTKIVKDTELINNLVKAGANLDALYGAVYKSCLVAQGRVSGYIEKEVNPHDIAATHIIVEEAGGKVTGYDGKKLDYSKPFRGAILSNGLVHEALVKAVKQ